MAAKTRVEKPEPEKTPARAEPAQEPEQTTDYKRAGGHVLTDFGWVLEEKVED